MISGLTSIIVFLLIYFMPALIANIKRHKNRSAIGITNLFFGWTGVGWLICLIWSLV